jgi:hypothetical protein
VTLTAAANGAATNPGDFSISTTNDLAAANLVQLINGTGTPGASNYIELSAANRRLLKNITASYSASTDILTITAGGTGTVVVSETLTPAANVWTTTKQQLHMLFALSKSVSLVVQKNPSLEENFVASKIGRDYISWAAYGIKVFVDQAPQIVQFAANSSAFTSAAQTSK